MKPILLDYMQKRNDDYNSVNYQYSHVEKLSLIEVNGTKKPFIDVSQNDVEALTKTLKNRESDDENFLFDFQTKTKVAREREDMQNYFLELSK